MEACDTSISSDKLSSCAPFCLSAVDQGLLTIVNLQSMFSIVAKTSHVLIVGIAA